MLAMLVMVNDASFQIAKNAEMLHSVCWVIMWLKDAGEKKTLWTVQCESKKSPPPDDLWQFFQNRGEFLNQILRAYYAFLSMLDCEFLFNNFDEVMPY